MKGIKKQTSLWKTRDGTKIRICDMSDSHLGNAMKFLETLSREIDKRLVCMTNPFTGEVAAEMFDAVQDSILEGDEDLDSMDDFPEYQKLCLESNRRLQIKEK